MNLICPECNMTKSATVVPVRLEVCPRCERSGRPSYLVPAPDSSRQARAQDVHAPSRRRG